ncbi:MAG TPA: hypothetical protein VIE63_15870, partial [Ramlibacter sp.]
PSRDIPSRNGFMGVAPAETSALASVNDGMPMRSASTITCASQSSSAVQSGSSFESRSSTAYTPTMATKPIPAKRDPKPPTMDDIARVFLSTPPDPHPKPAAKKAPKKASKPA